MSLFRDQDGRTALAFSMTGVILCMTYLLAVGPTFASGLLG